jgi:sigma-B regulation protein RsbU (phosphoserine phosphatase)
MTQSIIGDYLTLFAATEIFIFVFMEIVTKVEPIRKVIFKSAKWQDYAVFIGIFGLFSIFGTYIGIQGVYGAITNIRDLAPIVAGLIAGPFTGLAVGLIGGLHRLTLGGPSCIACSLATALSGLIAGLVFRFNKGQVIGIVPAIGFGVLMECLHGLITLVLAQPFSEAVAIVRTSIPQMMVAVSLGVGIGLIIVHNVIREEKLELTHADKKPD